MLTPGLSAVLQANEVYLKDWEELERFVTYELVQSVGHGDVHDTYRRVSGKMSEIKHRRHQAKRKNYRVFGKCVKGNMTIYLQDDAGRTSQPFGLHDLKQAWAKGSLKTDITFEELLRLSAHEWHCLIKENALDFRVRPFEDGTCYGALSALID